MKSKPKPSVLFILALLMFAPAAFAQWSDTKNQFTDNLHMPVTQAAGQQERPVIVRSYPDSGYFVIWEDDRNSATSRGDIYAQKYDKSGNRLWAADGIPIANGPNREHFTYSFHQASYRNYPVAATDSAGGFYITWIDDSLNQYTWQRIYAQNILSDGSRLIPGLGFQVAASVPGDNYDYNAPQLIVDGRGGFYVSYLKNVIGGQQVHTYNFKKQNGTFINNGGGWLNQYGRMTYAIGPCGSYTTTTEHNVWVYDYYIWPDGRGGCNVAMNVDLPGQGKAIIFNRVARINQNITTQILRRTTDVANCDVSTSTYVDGDVTVLHKFRMFSWTQHCSVVGPPPVAYSQLNTVIENLGQGFLLLDVGGYDYHYVKGLTLPTAGNIDVDVIVFVTRSLVGNTTTPFTTKVFSRAIEKYDSIPFELATNLTDCYMALRGTPEGKVLDKVNNFNDTILGQGGNYYHDFSIAGANGNVYATAIKWVDLSTTRPVYLQHLRLVQAGADTFALQFAGGVDTATLIGREVSTGAQSNSISYDEPLVTVDQQGNGVFSIREYYRFTRVSPIKNSTELAWGAMGKPTGTGRFSTNSYRPENPMLTMDPVNGTGLLAWQDDRHPPISGWNIHMRHLDSLLVDGHIPPNKPVQAFWPGPSLALPAVLYGTSNQYSVIEGFSSVTGEYSPIAEILDNANLGIVDVSVYTHNTTIPPIRTHNGKPYLNRNFTIKTQSTPPGATINLRLYFTTAEFDALKAADPTITSPGLLAVVKQAHSVISVPASYTPVAGEEIVTPKSWAAVPGGYYIEIEISGFSNFFIFKNENALPVTWVNIYAQWQNESQAKVSWQVTDEVNVEKYVVQHSKDGNAFTDACTVAATNGTQYDCIAPGAGNAKNYYRVMEVDKDGQKSYSKTVVLTGNFTDNLFTLYPNPANKVLNIQTSVDVRQITVIDGQGRSLFTHRGQNRITTIDVTRFSKGIYTLMIIDNNGTTHYRKFMVQ